uniref:Serrate RNA effector molecule homolog (Arabidopsis) n=1 Tax=Petromyzon marinus TaxID=7757 RepID=S4RZD4_PETMA
MGDSDDEYDRRRRDKFRRERSDYDRSRERDDRRRGGDDWNEREWDRGRDRSRRGDYRDYDRGRREISPPQKRMRRDWDDHGEAFRGGYDMPYGGGPNYGPPPPWCPPEAHMMPQPHNPIPNRVGAVPEVEAPPAYPIMKTFKEFLLSIAESVDETEAVRRYNNYKIEFRRQQLHEFFMAHKDEEWFRVKYHPEESAKRKHEAASALQHRLKAFTFLLEGGWFNSISLDIDKSEQIIRVLDAGAAVIKMEGGTDLDLQTVDQPEDDGKVENDGKDSRKLSEVDKKMSESSKEVADSGKQKKMKSMSVMVDRTDWNCDSLKSRGSRKRKRGGSAASPGRDAGNVSGSESDLDGKKGPGDGEKQAGEDGLEKESLRKGEDGVPAKPRALHRTCSLFMRNIAPNIPKSEIVAIFKRYPGFVRVALSDPQIERRFYRRGWVTFERSVNIKEICWSLQNIRLRECELSPVVNRDLARRVRGVQGITQHKPVVRNDIRLAAKLIQALDQKAQLWSATQPIKDTDILAPFSSQNPILKNITDYLIEEVSAEEDELLGNAITGSDEPKDSTSDVPLERDGKLLQVLDRLVLYLRIVHSVDYYNACEYQNEDEMPNRCGMIHVRGPLPTNRATHNEVTEYERQQEERLAPLLNARDTPTPEEAIKMGKKDPEQEVEKYVQGNTQEVGKDKWVCPFSGKKFKEIMEFLRKHIFNKHADKLGEVQREVGFFNNYLMDLKRPGPPEPKGTQPPNAGPPAPATGMGPNMGFPGNPQQGMMGFGQPRPPLLGYGGCRWRLCLPAASPYPPQFAGRGGYDPYRGQGVGFPGKPRGRGPRGDPRAIIEYRDLDAPDDIDFF